MIVAISKFIFFPAFLHLFDFRVNGLKRIPKNKNYIFAMNHCSALDVIVALSVIVPHTKRPISVIVDSKWYDFPIMHSILKSWNAIRVDLSDEESKKNVVREAKSFLRKGHNILIFPEGSTIGGAINEPVRGRTGAVQIAYLSKKEIIPVGISGSYKAWKFPASLAIRCDKSMVPSDSKFVYKPRVKNKLFDAGLNFFDIRFRHMIKLNFGKEYSLHDKYDIDLKVISKENKELLREMTTRLMQEISSLSGQRYRYI